MKIRALTLAAAGLTAVAALAVAAQAAPAKPDFSGMWLIRNSPDVTKTVAGKDPPLKPGVKRSTGKDPVRDCLPAGPVRAMVIPYPIKIMQRPNQLAMMFEFYHMTRIAYIGEKHPPVDEMEQNYMGNSVATWQGDTLVIDTVSFNGLTWLDHKGLPNSPKTHVVEKLRLIEGGKAFEDVITITDPDNYTAPWSERVVFDKRPDLKLQQHICGEPDNRKLPIPPAPKS